MPCFPDVVGNLSVDVELDRGSFVFLPALSPLVRYGYKTSAPHPHGGSFRLYGKYFLFFVVGHCDLSCRYSNGTVPLIFDQLFPW